MQLLYVFIKWKTLTIILMLHILFQPIVLPISTGCILCKRIFFLSLKNLRLHFWQNIVVGQRKRDIDMVKVGSVSLHVVTVGNKVIVGGLALMLQLSRTKCI